MNEKNKRILNWLTILLLLFCYPLGLLLMWFLTKWKLILKLLISLPLIILIIVIISWNYFITPYSVIGNSMYPKLIDSQYVLVNRQNKNYKRGDIVVYKNSSGGSDNDFIGRIVGLPNETILIKDEKVYINGLLLNENYLIDSTYGFNYEGIEQKIPPQSVFIMGDFRENSTDDRHRDPTRMSDIIGDIVYIFN